MHCVKDNKRCDDIVQCVPTKKGHQILYKGYTYIFKSRLQCGAEQWCCSYRQKTDGTKAPPEWVLIYFVKNTDKEYRCNICQSIINNDDKEDKLTIHIKDNHKEVYDLHKENPEATVGFRIEFLHLDVLKDDGDPKTQPIMLGEVCETTTEEMEIATTVEDKDEANLENVDMQYVLLPSKKKRSRRDNENRKRSWVWKYFDQLGHIVFRCKLCNVVLSIKGCNTNNMNRHVRTRHPSIYEMEMQMKRDPSEQNDSIADTDILPPVKNEIITSDKEQDETFETSSTKGGTDKGRRSWIWSYFHRLSGTLAQCKRCHRNICHGGNATGNMNRHLKMIHNITGATQSSAEENSWVWKVFESQEEDFYSCKICQYRCMKFKDNEKNISCILNHLKVEHGVISGSQIITTSEFGEEN